MRSRKVRNTCVPSSKMTIGQPQSTELSRGAVMPAAIPHGHPQIKPQSRTGICIGHSAEPISGIRPVIKGRTRAIARNNAEYVSF